MRPLDLLAFKIDEDHKNFIKEFHCDQKNFKIHKQYELYSWGHSDNYNLGYPQLNNEKKRPTKIYFNHNNNRNIESSAKLDKSDLTSIRDIKIAETYSLALTEDGDVFSWGSGLNGHLGHGD